MSRTGRPARHVHVDLDYDDRKPTAFEKLRANVPIWRTLATMGTVVLSIGWFTWQGSSWVSDIRGEMREMRNSLIAVTKSLDDKAAAKDVDHRFALLCARAPLQHKRWACETTARGI